MPDIFKSSPKPGVQKDTFKDYLRNGTLFIKKAKTSKGEGNEHKPSVHELVGHTHNPLAAFCYYPDNLSFIDKDPKEKVILLLRRHPITNGGWVSLVFLMILVPSFLPLFSFFELMPWGYQFVIILIWYLITFSFAIEKFLEWFFNVNIITDERIVDVDFLNLFYREITEADLDEIQDVTVEVGGGVRTLFHFGNLDVQTAAEVPRIEFEAIPNPDKVAMVLRELRKEEEEEKLEGRIS